MGSSSLSTSNHSGFVEARQHPRFKFETGICVYPRNAPLVRGDTVDISESGISAMLRAEVPLGEVVGLKFSVPAGDVEILALVRHRHAFRYGFQFMEGGGASALIRSTCAELELKHALRQTR